MLGLSELKRTKVYQEAKLEGILEVVPVLLETGLTVEQIATRLGLDIATVNEVAQRSSLLANKQKTATPRQTGKRTRGRKSSDKTD